MLVVPPVSSVADVRIVGVKPAGVVPGSDPPIESMAGLARDALVGQAGEFLLRLPKDDSVVALAPAHIVRPTEWADAISSA